MQRIEQAAASIYSWDCPLLPSRVAKKPKNMNANTYRRPQTKGSPSEGLASHRVRFIPQNACHIGGILNTDLGVGC